MTKKETIQKNLPIDKEKYDSLVQQCLEIIEKNNILFITDLVAFLPFGRSTFYLYQLDKSDTLKEAIEKQKIYTKQALRLQWMHSKSPALQIALYRMIATPEEKEAISIQIQQKNSEEQAELPIKQMFESIQKSMKEQLHND